jgi:hypothetical protein
MGAGFSASSSLKSRSASGAAFGAGALGIRPALAAVFALSITLSAPDSSDDALARAVFSSSLCAPARMSIGDFGFAPDVGEIEISSSSLKSMPLSSPSAGATSSGTGGRAICSGLSSGGIANDGASAAAVGAPSFLADAAATAPAAAALAAAAAAAAPLPPSANIGLFGSSWRPSATAFCHTSPWPCDTEYSSAATVSNADGLLCCAWISSSFR